jgi:transcriptional regulator with XRE-family HTH domain
MSELGLIIKKRLRELKYSQDWLAEKVGVSNPAVTKWIKSGKISRENALLVAKALLISVDTLLGERTLSIDNELERQLIMFFRSISHDHQDDLLTMANNLYNIDNPNDILSNPKKLSVKNKQLN